MRDSVGTSEQFLPSRDVLSATCCASDFSHFHVVIVSYSMETESRGGQGLSLIPYSHYDTDATHPVPSRCRTRQGP